MDDPAGPRKIPVNEFVAESLEEIASHSSDPQSLNVMAVAKRAEAPGKIVNVHQTPQMFLFRVKSSNQGMYAVRVKARDLKSAEECIATIPEIKSIEHIEESELPDAMFEKLTEYEDCARRQSSDK